MKQLWILAPVTVGILVLLGSASGVSCPGMGGELIVTERCVGCHDIDRVQVAIKVKDRAAWEQTLNNMAAKKEGLLSDSERKMVMDYLTHSSH